MAGSQLYVHFLNPVIPPAILTHTNVRQYVLVTGATGFIGAHVVDELLRRGLRVRGATRSTEKGEIMIQARPEYAKSLEFVQIDDFARPGRLDHAVQGVDAVIHVASVSCATDGRQAEKYRQD